MSGINTIEDCRNHRFWICPDTKNVYKVQSWFDGPSVFLKDIETGEGLSGGLGCLNLSKLLPLVPLDKKDDPE